MNLNYCKYMEKTMFGKISAYADESASWLYRIAIDSDQRIYLWMDNSRSWRRYDPWSKGYGMMLNHIMRNLQ